MEGSAKKEQENKKVTEVKTFSVPVTSFENKENIVISTQLSSNPSKDQIINEAFKFHSEGNILEAEKYYQYFINQGFNDSKVFSNYGVILNNLGKLEEAEISQRKAIELQPDYPEAHSNLGNVLRNLGKLEEAEIFQRKAIELQPDFAKAHFNLGIILGDLGKLEEAEISQRKAIELQPDFAMVHFNLGGILKDLGKLQDAEISTRKAIELQPDYPEAHSNLGGILKDLGKLQDAEISTRKAIELKSDLAEAHSNLGGILKDLGQLEEAELSLGKAIELKPDLAEAHSNLGTILKDLGQLEEAELSLKKAIELKPSRTSYFHYASCLFEKRSFHEAKKNLYKAISLTGNDIKDYLLSAAKSGIDYAKEKSFNQSNLDKLEYLNRFNNKRFDRIIINRTVENELLSYLYNLKNKELELTQDARYGKGVCSNNFELFQDNSDIISVLAKDIKNICKKELDKKEIIISDSFFNIFISGSGAKQHDHIQEQDNNFNLHRHKYSLVYYLEIGDQTSEEPGILKLYEPEEDILPTNGMIVIIEGKKNHSVLYRGDKDRVMIGVNFYAF